ncbi:hypothetical protein [Geobacillus sp. C56-T3]|uniref:hypothetical protein n=1 Tax=Geobacillus sp. (strain C56-T3) TaxID=691437 RepID=UPI0001D581A7|nr:hypothetical protein [Geobacillus sp. C56-T3]ADI25313.1 hypothetical protein GC56T3_0245 [Geobacillus sp. C56-T3]
MDTRKKKEKVQKAFKEGLEYRVAFPFCYTWMARTEKEYEAYATGYIKIVHPEFKVIGVDREKQVVICVKEDKMP